METGDENSGSRSVWMYCRVGHGFLSSESCAVTWS